MTTDENMELGGMVDISEVPLGDLLTVMDDDSVLAHALKRLIEANSNPKDPVSAFNSAL